MVIEMVRAQQANRRGRRFQVGGAGGGGSRRSKGEGQNKGSSKETQMEAKQVNASPAPGRTQLVNLWERRLEADDEAERRDGKRRGHLRCSVQRAVQRRLRLRLRLRLRWAREMLRCPLSAPPLPVAAHCRPRLAQAWMLPLPLPLPLLLHPKHQDILWACRQRSTVRQVIPLCLSVHSVRDNYTLTASFLHHTSSWECSGT